jgi:hypothetical protein
MLTTGNSFIEFLFIAVTFLPLIPALLTLFSNFGREPFNLILIICLVNFLRDVPAHLHMLTTHDRAVIDNICYPIELLLFALLFRPVLSRPVRYTLTIFLAAFLSSLLTWLSVQGFSSDGPGLETIELGALLCLILVCLPPLVRSKGLEILRSPLLWIGGGTLFYLLISLLLEWVTTRPTLPENSILLFLATLVRYLMYTLAVWPGRDEVPAEA